MFYTEWECDFFFLFFCLDSVRQKSCFMEDIDTPYLYRGAKNRHSDLTYGPQCGFSNNSLLRPSVFISVGLTLRHFTFRSSIPSTCPAPSPLTAWPCPKNPKHSPTLSRPARLRSTFTPKEDQSLLSLFSACPYPWHREGHSEGATRGYLPIQDDPALVSPGDVWLGELFPHTGSLFEPLCIRFNPSSAPPCRVSYHVLSILLFSVTVIEGCKYLLCILLTRC